MGRSRLAITAALGVAVILSGCGGSQGETTGGDSTAATGRPELRKCDIGTADYWRCGHIEVPAVRADPGIGTQKIGFALRPRDELSRPSLGSLVFVEGGPGYAATNADSVRAFIAVFAPFLKRHEVVLVDQRGTGRSDPLLCAGLQRERIPQLIGTAECAEQLGERYRGFTSAESAADLDAVSKALGLENVILYGDSYGTLLGQAYAVRYGENLDALILSSAYPADDPFWRTLYPAGVRALGLACDRDTRCRGDASARFRSVVARMEAGGIPSDDLLAYLMETAGTYAPASQRGLNRAVSAWLAGARGPLADLTRASPPGAGDPGYFSSGMGVAVECNDYPVPWDRHSGFNGRVAELNAAIEGFRPRNQFEPLTPRQWMMSPASDLSACLSWPPPSEEMEPPVPEGAQMPADLPTLVLAGEFDSITSVEEAEQVAARFPDSTLFVAPNRGHASDLYYPFTSPATSEIRQFVRRQSSGPDSGG